MHQSRSFFAPTLLSLAGLLMVTGCSILQAENTGDSTPVARLIPTAAVPATAAGPTTDQAGSPVDTSGEVMPTATSSPTSPALTATVPPTTTSSPTLEPTYTPSPQPAQPAQPTPGPPTATSPAAAVISFQASPPVADPGDTITLAWEATGHSATLCPSARFELFTADDCREVELAGTQEFVVPQEAAGFPTIDFTLTVGTLSEPDAATAHASVGLKCHTTWFFSDERQAGACPLEAIHSPAAAQHFERGVMIWLEQLGRYYVLEQTPVVVGETRKVLDVISDPLQVTGDTAAEIEPPPEGRYAPQSGFGLIWRGDVAQSAGYRQRLGWAIVPEIAYEAVLQCDDALPSGGRSWQTCYLQGPAGQVFVFDPLGGWYLLSQGR